MLLFPGWCYCLCGPSMWCLLSAWEIVGETHLTSVTVFLSFPCSTCMKSGWHHHEHVELDFRFEWNHLQTVCSHWKTEAALLMQMLTFLAIVVSQDGSAKLCCVYSVCCSWVFSHVIRAALHLHFLNPTGAAFGQFCIQKSGRCELTVIPLWMLWPVNNCQCH